MTRWREPTEAMERVYLLLRPGSYIQILRNAAKDPARFGLENDRALPKLLADIRSHHEGVLLHLADYAGPRSRIGHPALLDDALADMHPGPVSDSNPRVFPVPPVVYAELVEQIVQKPEEKLAPVDRDITSEIGLFVSNELLPDMVAATETLPDAVQGLPRPQVPKRWGRATAEGRIVAADAAGVESAHLREGLQQLRDVWQPRSGSKPAPRKL